MNLFETDPGKISSLSIPRRRREGVERGLMERKRMRRWRREKE